MIFEEILDGWRWLSSCFWRGHGGDTGGSEAFCGVAQFLVCFIIFCFFGVFVFIYVLFFVSAESTLGSFTYRVVGTSSTSARPAFSAMGEAIASEAGVKAPRDGDGLIRGKDEEQ